MKHSPHHSDDPQTLRRTPRLFCTAADSLGTTQNFGTRLTVDAVSSIANSHSAELDTPSVSRAASLPSSQELAIMEFSHDVANELLHAGFTYFFVKFLTILF